MRREMEEGRGGIEGKRVPAERKAYHDCLTDDLLEKEQYRPTGTEREGPKIGKSRVRRRQSLPCGRTLKKKRRQRPFHICRE